MRILALIALLCAATVPTARAQTAAPAVGQSAPLPAGPPTGEASPAPSIGTVPGLSAGPSGTAFGQAVPAATGASQGAPAPQGIEAPSAAPPVGVSVRLGNFADILAASNVVNGLAVARPAGLTVTPSITLQEELTSNAAGGTNGQADLITTISPGILINLATPHAVGTLNYSPSVAIYANHSDQDNVGQQLNGFIEAELLPQTLFLSLRAFASEQSTSGGLAPGGINTLSPNNRTTSTGFLVNPSFVHRFEDVGTLRIGYSLSEVRNSGEEAFLPSATTPFFVPSYALTNQGTASFTTGSSFGRFNNVVAATGAESTGTGVLNGAHQYVFSDTFRYAVLRQFYVFGTIGHENIFYSSVPPVDIDDVIWAGGIILVPQPNTTITIGYGHFEGIDSPFVNATIALSARTTLALSYTDLLGTSLQALQAGLANSVVNAAGIPVNSQTGIPVLFTNQSLGLQSSVTRDQIFSATLISTWPRDVYSLSFIDQNQKLIASAPGTAGFSQSSISAALAWSHVLSPSLTSVAYLQGGTTSSPTVGQGSTPTFAGQLSLIDRITPTLTGSASVQLTDQRQNSSGTALQAALIFAVQKVF